MRYAVAEPFDVEAMETADDHPVYWERVGSTHHRDTNLLLLGW